MRILLFGDGEWATASLHRLMAAGVEIIGVVMRRRPTDSAFSAAASALGVPVLRPERVNDAEFVRTVGELRPHLNLSVSYDQIIRRPLLDSAPLGFVNYHAGKLPQYRGRNVINWAIINDETEIGVTAHYVDEGIDTGDIILQRTVPIGWTDTYLDVLRNVVRVLPELVVETVGLIRAERAPRHPQPRRGTYFSARREGDEWLDWADSSRFLYNKVRAISQPGPGARTWLGREVVTVWRAAYDPAWPRYRATPGEVVGGVEGEGVIVKTGDSTLLVKEVQLAGGPPQSPRWPIGTRLGLDLQTVIANLQSEVDSLRQKLDVAHNVG